MRRRLVQAIVVQCLLTIVCSSSQAQICVKAGSAPPGTNVGGSDFDHTTSDPNCIGAFHCYEPERIGLGKDYYAVENCEINTRPESCNECDPELGTCSVRGVIQVKLQGLHHNHEYPGGFGQPWAQVEWRLGETFVGACGGLGHVILNDYVETWLQVSGFSCDDPDGVLTGGAYEVEISVCDVASACPKSLTETINLSGPAIAESLCGGEAHDPPPQSEARQCSATPAGGAEVFGNGLTTTPANGSPAGNPALTYRAGGAGHPGLPGSDEWKETLGLYWSHEAAQRIVPDPDEGHVWLITEFGSFREFGDLVAGLYGTNSPSDEFRELHRTGTGWELHDLDGSVIHFHDNGSWWKTVDRNDNTTAATYTDGRLTKIDFPDKWVEIFSYHADGKLAKIEEFGIDGETHRDWMYTWTDDLLVRIERPDGTFSEFFYNDPDLEGYMTRMDLVGTEGESRVERGWEFDDSGNVTRTWKGPTATDATGDHPVLTGDEKAVDVWSYSYDDPLKPELTTVTDPLDNTAEYHIEWIGDGKPRLTTITGDCPSCGLDPNVQFEYDPSHPLLPSAIIDGEGNRTELFYDDHGQLEMRDEALDDPVVRRQTMWTYDLDFHSFPTLIRQASVGEADNRETEMFYDSDTGDLDWREIRGYESTWDEDGHFALRSNFSYNGAGQPETIDPPGYDGTDGTSFVYDEAERGGLVPLSRTDPIIGTTTFDYDTFNRRVMVTDPNGVQTETVYDMLDRVSHVIQRSAMVAPGDPIVEADLVTQHCYSEFGDLSRTILPRGNVIEYGYDSAGRLISIERKVELLASGDCDVVLSPGERTLYTLDTAGNRINEKLQRWDPAAADWATESEMGFEYSTRCQLDKILHPDDTVTEYSYDCNGNLEQTWDAEHKRSDFLADPSQAYEYDALDRLRNIEKPWTGPGGNRAITTYEYDVQDHLIQITDAEGNVTDYEYSDRDLLTQQRSEFLQQPGCLDPDSCEPGCGCASFAYNSHGELIQEIDARGVVVDREVDALDRVKLVDYPDDTLDTTYDYDTAGSCTESVPLGRLSSIIRNGESVDYCYDRFGRVTEDGALGFDYDENGNRTMIDYPGDVSATYSYDFADRQKTLTVDDGVEPSRPIVTGSTYKPSGPLASLDLGNSLSENRGFDQRYFPDSIAVSGEELDRSWIYETDFVGNIEQIRVEGICGEDLLLEGETLTGTETLEICGEIVAANSLTIATGADITFRAGDRIVLGNGFSVEEGAVFTAEVDPSISGDSFLTYIYQDYQYFLEMASGPWGELSWTYDKIGNRLSEERNEETDVYHYHKNTAVPPGNTPLLNFIAVAGSGKRQYEYGVAGHLDEVDASGNVIDFNSDDAGRLSEIDRTVVDPVSLAYDGRSFLSRVEKPSAGPDLGWLEPVYSSEGRVHCLTRQESPSAPEQAFHLFYFAGRPVAQLALEDGGNPTWSFLTTDHLGTPLLATDIAGVETWSGPFEPFGEDPLKGTPDSALANNVLLRFPGQWEDEIWQEATEGVPLYYNLHRWLEYGTGRYGRVDPLEASHNDYGYVDARPLLLTDPLGLISLDPSCANFPPGDDGDSGDGCCFGALSSAVQQYNEFFTRGWRQRNPDCWEAIASKSALWTPRRRSQKDLSPLSCMIGASRSEVIKCNPELKQCGETTPRGAGAGDTFFGSLVCDAGECPSPLHTLFHEQLHRCGGPGEIVPPNSVTHDLATKCVGL